MRSLQEPADGKFFSASVPLLGESAIVREPDIQLPAKHLERPLKCDEFAGLQLESEAVLRLLYQRLGGRFLQLEDIGHDSSSLKKTQYSYSLATLRLPAP